MASSKIKGITIEIGGDTTKLGTALKDTETKVKNLQGELRGVNTLLKMDPSNVTLLTQKQELLTQAIAETKGKLDTLKTAQSQVQEQFERGEITEEQYRDLQREIVSTEQKLEKLNDELKDFGSVGAQQVAQVGEKMKDVGGKVEDVGKKFSVVSAGAGAILAGSMVAFTELDEGYDTIVTKTGATGDALDSLNESANNVFGNMPTDMATVGVAIGEINTRFGYTGEQLETLSTQFIQFAEINGVDLNNSIGTVDKVLEQFNMDASEAGNVLDLITLKAQQTGIGADTLMNSIQENGATFKDMGIGVNEAVVMMAQFEANGVNVQTALKGLKKATTEYAEEGLSMEEGLAKTLETIKNAKTETEALAEAQEIFGTKGANEMVKAIREGRLSVDDLTASMSEYGGVVKDTYEGTLDPIDQSTVAMNNLKLAGSELATVLQSVFAPMLTTVVNALKDLVSWFGNLSPQIQKVIVIVLSVITALGPLLIVVGNIITSIGSLLTLAPKIVTAFTTMKTAFSALSAVFMANPIGIVIAVLGALVTAFITAYNHSEKFRTVVNNAFTKVKEICTNVTRNTITAVVNFFKELPSKITTQLTNVLSNVTTWGANLATKGKEAGTKLLNAVVNKVKEIPGKVKTIGGQIVTGLWNGIKNSVSWIKEKVGGFANEILNGMKSALDIHSPSKKAEKEVGEQIANGVINGVNKKKANAKKSAKELAELYISEGKTKVAEMKAVNELTLADEVVFWETILSHCTKGSEEYNDATQQLKLAKQNLNEELGKLDRQYAEDSKKIMAQLETDIKSLTDAYDKAVADRQKQIMSSMGLFDAFSADEAIGKDDLTANLQSQVDALHEWDATLDDLADREGMDADLLAELEGMGVSSLSTLKEIQSMTDEELSAYIGLYQEKKAIALDRSKDEHEALKYETEVQIQALILQANDKMEALEETYTKNIQALGINATKESKVVGTNIVQGIMDGIDSQMGALRAKMLEVSEITVGTAKAELDINSPSRVFADAVGKWIPAGIAQGILSNAGVASDAVQGVTDGLINGATINRQLATTFDSGSVTGTADNSLLDKLNGIYDRLGRLQIVLDTGTLVGETIDKIDNGLANRQLLNARGV